MEKSRVFNPFMKNMIRKIKEPKAYEMAKFLADTYPRGVLIKDCKVFLETFTVEEITANIERSFFVIYKGKLLHTVRCVGEAATYVHIFDALEIGNIMITQMNPHGEIVKVIYADDKSAYKENTWSNFALRENKRIKIEDNEELHTETSQELG